MTRLVLIIPALALASCASTPQRIETPLAERIPSSLLTCRDRPKAGALDRQSDVARYVVELDQAGQDCRRKVEAINQIVRADATNGEAQ